jgi:Protein of unknown function (DUF3052)
VHKPRNDDKTTPVVAKFWYEPALNTEWMLQSMGEWAMEGGGDWRKVPLLPAACRSRSGLKSRLPDRLLIARIARTFASTNEPMSAGYSGTPLLKKLGIAEATHVALIGAPSEYESLIGPLPAGANLGTSLSHRTDLVHAFVTQRDELAVHLVTLRRILRDDAVVWVSWPKKASKVATTVTEDVVRELALPLGFVDTKVCAVSEVWSGLKLVVRKELRGRRVR